MTSEHTAIACSAAPAPLPQFSQAIKYNGLLFCSGSIGIDPATGKLVEGTTKDRARQALHNLQNVVEAAGSSMGLVLKTNVFLTDMANFAHLNEAWDEVFTQHPKPARTCIAVSQLPRETDVEIELIAIAGQEPKAKV